MICATSKIILVVDDDIAILEAIKIVLEDQGYMVMTAACAEDVAARMEQIMPDMIIFDIWLPGENGDSITRAIKSNKETEHIPIIILSANQDIRRIAQRAKADDFLPKPFDIDDLLGLVKKYTAIANA